MYEAKLHEVPKDIAEQAHIKADQYREMYRRSLEEPDAFWGEQADQFLSWSKMWDKVQEWDFNKADIKWFPGGELNVSYNCLDRHLESRGDQVAIIWEGDDPKEDREITYRQLHEETCRFANALKEKGVKKR